MAKKSDFTEQEWEALQKGVVGAGLLVSLSDRGFFDTFKEAGALSKHVAAAHEHSESTLVKQVAEGHGTGFGVTAGIDKVETETLEALKAGVALLKEKAPEELEAYRAFVLELARSVAAAAPGGDEVEAAAIAKIEPALA
jgi:hypothetical protein